MNMPGPSSLSWLKLDSEAELSDCWDDKEGEKLWVWEEGEWSSAGRWDRGGAARAGRGYLGIVGGGAEDIYKEYNLASELTYYLALAIKEACMAMSDPWHVFSMIS